MAEQNTAELLIRQVREDNIAHGGVEEIDRNNLKHL